MVAKLARKNKDGHSAIAPPDAICALYLYVLVLEINRAKAKKKRRQMVRRLSKISSISEMYYCRSALEITILCISEVPS